jgi:membrane protease YdiL (CAAX protease family)
VSTWVEVLISSVIALLGLLGLAYWAARAQTDRSARVGIYLLFGIPAGLLLIAGLAVLVRGDRVLAALLLPIGVGLGVPLIRPFREALARVTPLDPDSAIELTGLCVVLGLLGFFLGSSLAPTADEPPELLPAVGIAELLIQAASFVAIAYIAVGLPWWRDPRQATDRLGIVAPDPRTLGVAAAGTVACFAVAILAGLAAEQLDPGLSERLNEAVEQITANVQNPLGAVILGASAGIGEEAVFRGALQPRFGLVIPSLLFTMLHGPQYGFNPALLGLFAVSIILGLERKYVNTTAAMLTHALYNALQVLALSAVT